MVMTKTRALVALTALAIFSTARSACDDLEKYFGDVSSVSKINLDVIRVDCPANDDGEALEEVVIEAGKTLTITTTRDYVRFVNLRFTVEDGASLVFDMDKTRFGPNSGDSENAPGFMLDVKEGGSVTFNGKFRATKVDNVRSVFFNAGTIEFKGNALFIKNGNVFRSNSGTLKFRGNTTFKKNFFLAIDNIDSGFVRFSKKATFDDNAGSFDGTDGCAISNGDEATVIFRDDVIFENHDCDEGAAVGNSGKMRFYGKAIFNDNTNKRDWGGGANNHVGTMIFKDAVEFNGNEAEYGGGLAVEGGQVTFEDSVTFDGNLATITGGAFSLTLGGQFGTVPDAPGSLTFEKPDEVVTAGNFIDDIEDSDEVLACTLAFVEEGTTLVGFDREDVCVEA